MTATGQTSRRWTAAEDDNLRRLYPTHSAGEIASAMGRTRAAIKGRTYKLGLHKTTRSGRFTPGHSTWNKGMRGLDIGGKATRFKPGNKPHGWRPIGHTRENPEGYLERKIADTGTTRRDYVNIHRLVWRMHGRQIPPGHVVIFCDGNKRNFDINNLQLIHRAELMRRNSVHNQYPPEVTHLVQLRGALTRQINNRTRKPA